MEHHRVSLTISGVGMNEPQLQTGCSRVLFAAVRWVHEPLKIPLQRVQQNVDQGIVGLV